MKYSYDEKCLDLARHFYPNQSIAFLEALAQAFQDCVEGREDTEMLPIPDFLRNQENLRAERASQETRPAPCCDINASYPGKHRGGCQQETRVNLPEIPPGSMPPDPGPDPTKLEYDEWVARTKECPACHGQGCEPHETDEGRLICGPGCARCEGAGRIPL